MTNQRLPTANNYPHIRRACKELGVSFTSIEAPYSEPHRKYHNLDHLESMLVALEEIGGVLPRIGPIVQAAILYHDIVYSKDWYWQPSNEDYSIAEFARSPAYGALEGHKAGAVVRCIGASRNHLVDQKCAQAVGLFLDLDLHCFVGVNFFEHNKSIMAELLLLKPIVDPRKLLEGRKAFLEKLLKRKALFYYMWDWEGDARYSIRYLIDWADEELSKDHEQ